MNSKRDTIGDLDRVLQELGTFSIDFEDAPYTEPAARPRMTIPRVSLVEEAPEIDERKSSTSFAEYENMSPPGRSHPSSEAYSSVVEEIGRRLSQPRESFDETDYAEINEEEALFSTEDYVDIDSLHILTPAEKRLSEKSQTTSLPRTSLTSHDVALAKLKANSEPRRKTEPAIATVEDKMNFLRDASRKLSQKSNRRQAIVNFYNPDDSYKTIIIEQTWLAKEICEILIMKNRFPRKITWQLFERLEEDNLERPIEDHENIWSIFEQWEIGLKNKFILRENFKKYDFFQNPLDYVPNHLLDEEDTKKTSADARDKKKAAKEALVKEMALKSNRIIDIEGLLWIKESGGKWKEAFSFVRTSGVYFSVKGKSKEAKHIRQLVDFTEVFVYSCYDKEAAKKIYQAKTDFLLVFKKPDVKETVRDLVCVCTRNRRNQLSFEQCVKMAKFGTECLRNNFQMALKKMEKVKQLHAGIERNKKRKQFEQSVQKEIEFSKSKEWFYTDITKETASEIVSRERRNGAFLIRLTNGDLFLTLHNFGKIHHFVIQTMDLALEARFSIEEGTRTFSSLTELIDFYRSDMGSLPCALSFAVKKGFTRLPMNA